MILLLTTNIDVDFLGFLGTQKCRRLSESSTQSKEPKLLYRRGLSKVQKPSSRTVLGDCIHLTYSDFGHQVLEIFEY